mmetsp:Transcript_3781/g.14349  ORF Transcript_3781/g.14349 Transcript_3781/m.14349 type:complete len:95 (+) Transcript_3781:84-368(+)
MQGLLDASRVSFPIDQRENSENQTGTLLVRKSSLLMPPSVFSPHHSHVWQNLRLYCHQLRGVGVTNNGDLRQLVGLVGSVQLTSFVEIKRNSSN